MLFSNVFVTTDFIFSSIEMSLFHLQSAYLSSSSLEFHSISSISVGLCPGLATEEERGNVLQIVVFVSVHNLQRFYILFICRV